MIRGRVVGRPFGLQAEVVVTFLLAGDAEKDEVVIVDTGYTEDITLPSALIKKLQLPFAGRTEILVGNSITVDVGVYFGLIKFGERRIPVDVYEVEGDPLLGMSFLKGLHLYMEVEPEGAVEISNIE